MGSIPHHIMPLVINSLGGDTHAHAKIPTSWTKTTVPGLKIDHFASNDNLITDHDDVLY